MENQITAPKLMSPVSLCQVLERLIEILVSENETLKTRKPADIKDSLTEKTRLVAVYNQQMGLIKNNSATYKTYPKADIDQLKKLSETFYAVLDEHFRLLSNVKTVSEGIVRAVAEEVQKKNRPVPGYSANARQNVARNNASAAYGTNSISVNQVI
jgi:uncharacterized protein YdcH (DUF465 family)